VRAKSLASPPPPELHFEARELPAGGRKFSITQTSSLSLPAVKAMQEPSAAAASTGLRDVTGSPCRSARSARRRRNSFVRSGRARGTSAPPWACRSKRDHPPKLRRAGEGPRRLAHRRHPSGGFVCSYSTTRWPLMFLPQSSPDLLGSTRQAHLARFFRDEVGRGAVSNWRWHVARRASRDSRQRRAMPAGLRHCLGRVGVCPKGECCSPAGFAKIKQERRP
jgi:hypothetical protein